MLKENTEKFLNNATKDQLLEIRWLLDNPAFEVRPVDIITFVNNKNYLGLKFTVMGDKGFGCRPRILDRLSEIFDSNELYEEFVLMCGIGWGKDFASSIVLTYQLYRLQCLKDPQSYHGLSKGTTIHLMLMSINEKHARDVLFSEIKARIDHSGEELKKLFWYNKKIVTEFQFRKNISLIPGNSKDTTFVGYNIFCGIIDEGDDYMVTEIRNDAIEGYNSIKQRILSRFGNKGMLGIIGSPKTVDGFMMTMYNNEEEVSNRYKLWVTSWDSKIDTPLLCGKFFKYDDVDVPIEYQNAFRTDPETALRDLVARPRMSKQPYMTLSDRIQTMFNNKEVPYELKDDNQSFLRFIDSVRGNPEYAYYIHLDLAINRKKGDKLGFAIGHSEGYLEIDGTEKPKIEIDIAMSITAPPGGEIQFSEIREMIYFLERMGFNFVSLTADSWNSVDTIQIMNSHGIPSVMLSVDRDIVPYEDLKKAIYEDRVRCHKCDLLKKELERLEIVNGDKVDHPPKGSKDIADAVCGVVHCITKAETNRILIFSLKAVGKREF